MAKNKSGVLRGSLSHEQQYVNLPQPGKNLQKGPFGDHKGTERISDVQARQKTSIAAARKVDESEKSRGLAANLGHAVTIAEKHTEKSERTSHFPGANE
jgi:hypothetical protein